MKQFNVNKNIYVCLTQEAIDKHNENMKELHEHTSLYKPSRYVAGALTEIQLWVFMQNFGSMFQIGFNSPIIERNNIGLEDEDLQNEMD